MRRHGRRRRPASGPGGTGPRPRRTRRASSAPRRASRRSTPRGRPSPPRARRAPARARTDRRRRATRSAAREVARAREGLDGALGDRAVARVEVERRARRLLQVERDRPAGSDRRSAARTARFATRRCRRWPFALGERRVGHVAERRRCGTATRRAVLRSRTRSSSSSASSRRRPPGGHEQRQLPLVEPAAGEDRRPTDELARRGVRAGRSGPRSPPGRSGEGASRSAPAPRGGRSRSSRRSIPVISMMKNGLPPAWAATRSASSSSRSPASSPGGPRASVCEGLDPERHRVGEPAGPVRSVVEQLPSGDADHEQRQAAGLAQELLDQVEQQRVGAVQVLEDEHDRPLRGEPGRASSGPRPGPRRRGSGSPRCPPRRSPSASPSRRASALRPRLGHPSTRPAPGADP